MGMHWGALESVPHFIVGVVLIDINKYMGQYYKGRKIGTCENMYFMRLEEAQRLAAMGARDDDGILFSDYLKDNVTRWRFPFPTEDDGVHQDCIHDKGFNLPAGGIEMSHDTIAVHNQHQGGGYGFNIILPCPHSKEFKELQMGVTSEARIKVSTGGAGEQFLTVRYQAIRDGQEKTIFECARCGSAQRFSDDEIVKLKARAMEYFAPYDCTDKNAGYAGNQGLYDYAMKIIARIK